MKYTRHALGSFLPELTNHQKDELEHSVRTLGLTRPIIIYENAVLDGWHVYQFAMKHNKPLRFEQFGNTTMSALDYRVSTAKGRSLTTGQKAVLALKYYDAIKNKGQKKHNRFTPKDQLKGENRKNHGATKAAEAFGIARSSVESAKIVRDRSPKIFAQLEAGKINVNKAYKAVTAKSSWVHGTRAHVHLESEEKRVRKIMDKEEFEGEYNPPSNVYESDQEFWKFDRYLRTKGFNLSLTRIGDTWDAVYARHTVNRLGHISRNAAILEAGRKALSLIKQEEETQQKLAI